MFTLSRATQAMWQIRTAVSAACWQRATLDWRQIIGIALLATLCVLAFSGPVDAQFATSGPVLPAERTWTETSRDVAAADYRDAYCARWSDGCSVCERTSANEQPRCRAANDAQATCEQKSIQCQALLKSVNRVCLGYFDGCNNCALGGCTMMFCGVRQADGTVRKKDSDYICRAPRRARYANANALSLDLHGHWRLTDANGRACEIVNFTAVALTPDCIALGVPVTKVRSSRVSGSTFELRTAYDGDALLSFNTSDLNELAGTGAASGYRLTRLEVEAMDPRHWEGSWRLSLSGQTLGGLLLDGVSACDLFLAMRLHHVGPHPHADVVRVPHGISLASNCLSPTDPNMMMIRHLDGARPRILLPRWMDWQFEGHTITFRDDLGHRTTFRRTTDAWTTELPQPGYPPVIMRLERRRP